MDQLEEIPLEALTRNCITQLFQEPKLLDVVDEISATLSPRP